MSERIEPLFNSHVVMFSTGAASAEVAHRVINQHGRDTVTLLTADTLVEDIDNWRFAQAVATYLGDPEWITIRDGRTPMQAGRDERVVPNNRLAVCSRILKRDLMRTWLDTNRDPAHTLIHLGYDWTEEHRLTKAAPHWLPWTITAPLNEPPYMTKAAILDAWRKRGIEPPRLYGFGFGHANCGGACVRGGQAAWARLLEVLPDRYREWEAEEQQTRAMLGKDVSILTDRGGTRGRRPLTLRTFRERIETQPRLFDADDWGECGCLIDQ